MSKKKTPKKPAGELGSLQIGKGTATYRRKQWPPDKRAIEQAALDSALRAAKSRGVNLYNLTQPPEQNKENDFDFTLTTSRGPEDLDLMEVVLRLDKGGYDALPTSYNIAEMVAANLAGILEKSCHYVRASRPLHLLLYSTDWRLALPPHIIDALAAEVARQKHVFSTINYIHAADQGAGTLESVFPRQVPSQLVSAYNASFVVFGDMRHPEVQEDGSVSVPMSLPQLEPSGRPEQPRPEKRLWICQALCGCELEILAIWTDPPVRDHKGRIISDRHPAPGTLETLSVVNVCADHMPFLSGPQIEETYGGEMAGYLHRPQMTEAESLYVALTRFSGQKVRPDTCDCQMFETWDRTKPGTFVRKHHPRLTRHCSAHVGDTDHSAAVENNRRKNLVVNRLASEFGLPADRIEWGWTGDRLLLITASGLSPGQRAAAQEWCDASLGVAKVTIV